MSGSTSSFTRRRAIAATAAVVVVLAVMGVGVGSGDVLQTVTQHWQFLFVAAGLAVALWGIALLVWVPLSHRTD